MTMKRMNLMIAVSLVAFGVLGRIAFRTWLPHGNDLVLFDMWASVGSVSVIAGALLGRRYGIAVPVLTMAISDAYINSTLVTSGASYIGQTALFTWSGFAMVGVLSHHLARDAVFAPRGIGMMTGAGLMGVAVFDLWTNFGVWIGPWYAHSWEGLVLCFTLALPFTIGHLLTTATVLPLVSVPYLYLTRASAEAMDPEAEPATA